MKGGRRKILGWFILVLTLAICGCEPYTRKVDLPTLPPELKECTFHRVSEDGMTSFFVARCPNSATATTTNKHKRTVIVYDGEIEVKGAKYGLVKREN